MKIHVLHYYPGDDKLIKRHIEQFVGTGRHDVTFDMADSLTECKDKVKARRPDIIHIHGCWQHTVAGVDKLAWKEGIRTVVTPHGQLEPWYVEQNKIVEKMPKMLLWQNTVLGNAYSLIAQGNMERQCLEQKRLNPNVCTILNVVVTSLTTHERMVEETITVYRNVMDSNPLPLMTEETQHALHLLLKLGVSNDIRSISSEGRKQPELSEDQWRHLIIYAYYEGVMGYVKSASDLLGWEMPDINPKEVKCFLPLDYAYPNSLLNHLKGNKEAAIDNIVALIRQINSECSDCSLPLLHLCELSLIMRKMDIDEGKAMKKLEDKHLSAFTKGLMQVLAETAMLEEGFMIAEPEEGRKAESIRLSIQQHLEL